MIPTMVCISPAWRAAGFPGSGFCGNAYGGGLDLNPFLPDAWQGYSFQFDYRSRLICVEVQPGLAKVTLQQGEPVELTLCGESFTLSDSVTHEIH